MRYNYIYKIVCLCGSFAGHYYIGKHTTGNLDDKYTGSGILIKDYFKKYGKVEGETYEKTIIEFNETPELNSEREKQIIGSLWVDDPLCLNLMEGGKSSGMKGKKHSETWIEKMRGKTPWNKGKKATEEAKRNQSTSHLGHAPWNKGKTMSKEFKEKISSLKKGQKYDRAKHVIQFSVDGSIIKEWHSAHLIEKETGFKSANIYNCCNGKLSQAYGFVWKFAS